jgi:hypothetical protein
MNGIGRSRRQARTRWGGKSPAFALVALLAVFLQAFVVQTHVHGPAPIRIGIERPSADHPELHALAGDEHQIACALCQTLASAGAATLPSAASVLASGAASTAAIIAIALAPRALSHAWRSRAPPTHL